MRVFCVEIEDTLLDMWMERNIYFKQMQNLESGDKKRTTVIPHVYTNVLFPLYYYITEICVFN